MSITYGKAKTIVPDGEKEKVWEPACSEMHQSDSGHLSSP
jgi:hypothetical protein